MNEIDLRQRPREDDDGLPPRSYCQPRRHLSSAGLTNEQLSSKSSPGLPASPTLSSMLQELVHFRTARGESQLPRLLRQLRHPADVICTPPSHATKRVFHIRPSSHPSRWDGMCRGTVIRLLLARPTQCQRFSETFLQDRTARFSPHEHWAMPQQQPRDSMYRCFTITIASGVVGTRRLGKARHVHCITGFLCSIDPQERQERSRGGVHGTMI